MTNDQLFFFSVWFCLLFLIDMLYIYMHNSDRQTDLIIQINKDISIIIITLTHPGRGAHRC